MIEIHKCNELRKHAVSPSTSATTIHTCSTVRMYTPFWPMQKHLTNYLSEITTVTHFVRRLPSHLTRRFLPYREFSPNDQRWEFIKERFKEKKTKKTRFRPKKSKLVFRSYFFSFMNSHLRLFLDV